MILPRLYAAETTDFSSNGIGTLTDAIECTVTQGFGSSILEMKYPVDGKLFKELQSMRIIYAQPEPNATPQPYSIYTMKKTASGIVYVYARHVCYNLDGWIVKPFSASPLVSAIENVLEHIVLIPTYGMSDPQAKKYQFNFKLEADAVLDGRFFKNDTLNNAWAVIGQMPKSLLETFGGEIEFDQYTVRIRRRIGQDNGVSIRYGKNLLSLEQEENFSKSYSGVFAYAKTIYGDQTEIVLAPGKHPIARLLAVDLTDSMGDSSLSSAAEEYIAKNNIGKPEVNLSVKLSHLKTGVGYEDVEQLENISMGDTVHVYFPSLDVYSSARVSQTVYDCLRGCYDSIQIGSERKNAADVIENQQRQINRLK